MKVRILFVFIFTLFTPFLLAETTTSPANSVAIISGKNIDALTDKQIFRLFTLRQKLVPNNKPVKIVCHPLSSITTKVFAKNVFRLYPYQLKRVWNRQVYSGKSKGPVVIEDEERLIQFISNNPNSLGYILNDSALLLKYQGEINVIAVY